VQPHPGLEVTPTLRLERLLGEGGMGSVWEAEHLGLNARVAVKFIDADLAAESPSLVARFEREARAIAALNSPHIVKVFDTGQTLTGLPYIVMELLDGEDLHSRFERDRRLPLVDVTTILAQTARALDRTHQAGIVHRDIKPDNLFLIDAGGDDIFVKVLDFGVAKQTKAHTQSVVTMTGTMIGTPAYMSPEQILNGKDVDHRSDLWSLGVVAYHALVGEPPFDGETLGALCVAIAAGKYPPASQLRPELPDSIDAWFERALALEPSARFDTVKEMALAFDEAARGLAPPPREDAALSTNRGVVAERRRSAPAATPHPHRLGIAIAAAVALLCGGLAALALKRPNVSAGIRPDAVPTVAAASASVPSRSLPSASASGRASTRIPSSSAPPASTTRALGSTSATPSQTSSVAPATPAPPAPPANIDRGF
jgi:eukaryotic-like serine/threonine-protein kinase